MRMDQRMGVELTDEQKLDLVFFEVTHEEGRLAKVATAVDTLKHAAEWSWKRLGYDILKGTGTILLTSAIVFLVGLLVIGARVQLVGAGTP